MADWIRVYASQLDFSGAHLFWKEPPPEELCLALLEVGQLEPVLVRSEGQRYRLLSGYRRATFLAQSDQAILARCMPGQGAPVEDGLTYLHANVLRQLDDAMRIRALRYFQPLLGPGELAERIAPALRTPPRSGTWRNLLNWLALPESWDDFLHTGNIPLAAAAILNRLPPEDLETLRPYLAAWKWSQGRAVAWLTMLRETSLHRGWTMGQVLEASSSRQVLEADLAPQDALHRLTAQVRTVRYPHLERMQRRFTDLARQLLGSSRWEIAPSPDFESDAVQLRLMAKNAPELRCAAQVLHLAATSESHADLLEGLFQIAREEDPPGT